MAYEDLPTRQRAERFVKWLGDRFGRQFRMECMPWELLERQIPEQPWLARAEMKHADMMVLSIHAANGMAATTREKLESFLAGGLLGEGALVALVDEEGDRSRREVPVVLRQMAARHGVTFFWRSGYPVSESGPSAKPGAVRQENESPDATPRLSGGAHPKMRWGLKE